MLLFHVRLKGWSGRQAVHTDVTHEKKCKCAPILTQGKLPAPKTGVIQESFQARELTRVQQVRCIVSDRRSCTNILAVPHADRQTKTIVCLKPTELNACAASLGATGKPDSRSSLKKCQRLIILSEF